MRLIDYNSTMKKQINISFAVLIMVLLMIATRGHDNWLSSFVHLPDFTIPALFIAGIYFRHFWVAFTLIFSAIAIDNYAIMYQGISANCITPAYSVLPLTYYGIFWVGKQISTLIIGDNIIKNAFVITTAVSMQWLVATGAYYFFTETYAKTGWGDFPTYVAHWSIAEISVTLYWMAAVIIIFTLTPRTTPNPSVAKL
ncbi:Optional hypothetical component of the B12 transporter BtuM [uncultured Gammaproteobacteria bacterium]|nr:Optional hypothetical component of the B12 transporter BtuM [uncultured Gammaproteobacteria bacterium]